MVRTSKDIDSKYMPEWGANDLEDVGQTILHCCMGVPTLPFQRVLVAAIHALWEQNHRTLAWTIWWTQWLSSLMNKGLWTMELVYTNLTDILHILTRLNTDICTLLGQKDAMAILESVPLSVVDEDNRLTILARVPPRPPLSFLPHTLSTDYTILQIRIQPPDAPGLKPSSFRLRSLASYPRPALCQRNPLAIQIPPTYSHSRHLRFICIYIYTHIYKYIYDIYIYILSSSSSSFSLVLSSSSSYPCSRSKDPPPPPPPSFLPPTYLVN